MNTDIGTEIIQFLLINARHVSNEAAAAMAVDDYVARYGTSQKRNLRRPRLAAFHTNATSG
jgi:hypothetical protein